MVGLGLIPRLDGLVAILDPTAGVQDDARLLVNQRARQIVHRGIDFRRIHIRCVPEAGGLGDDLVGHDQPIEVGHGTAHVAGVGGRMAGVHAPVEAALDNALLHELERGNMRIVHGTCLGRDLRPPVVTVVVVHGGVLAEPLLQGGDDELRLIGVVAVGIGLRFQPLAQACAIGGVRPLQVGGMLVDHHAHVRCTLDVGLAAQRVHAAAGDADVAKQQLHHGHGARVLGAIGVLGLAERVEHGAGLTGLGGRGIGFVDEFENILVHTADTANGVERVTGIVLLELLVDAHGVLQRHVLLGVDDRRRGELRGAGLVNPDVRAVLAGVPATTCAIAADVGVLFGVHQLPVLLGLRRERLGLRGKLERHRGCQRSAGCFEKAPCVTGSCPSLLSYSSCTRLKTDAKPPTVPSCRLEAAGRRRRGGASRIRIVRLRILIHANE